jgi:hypothetical protein
MSGVIYKKILKKDGGDNNIYVITYYDSVRSVLEYCGDPTKHSYVRLTEVSIKNEILTGKNDDDFLKFEILNDIYDIDELFEYSIEKNFIAIDSNGDKYLYQINAIENNVFQVTNQDDVVPNTIEIDLYSGIEREENENIIFLSKIDYDDDDEEEIDDYTGDDNMLTSDTNEFVENMLKSNVDQKQIIKFDTTIKDESVTNTILRNRKLDENIKNSKYLFRESDKFPSYNDLKSDNVDYDETSDYNKNVESSLKSLRIQSGNVKVETRTKVLYQDKLFIARKQYKNIDNTYDKVNFKNYIFKLKTAHKEYKVNFDNIPLDASDIKRFKDSGVPDYIILKFLNSPIYELKKEFQEQLYIPSGRNTSLLKEKLYDNDITSYTDIADKPIENFFKITNKINRISDNTDTNDDLLRIIWNSSGIQEKLNILSDLRYVRHAKEKEDIYYYYDINTNQRFIPIHEYYRLTMLLSKNEFYKNALKDQWVLDTNTEQSHFKSFVNNDKILENNNEINDKPQFGMNTNTKEVVHIDEELKRLSEINGVKATLKDFKNIADTLNDAIKSLFNDAGIEDYEKRIHLSKMNNVEYINVLYNIRKYEIFINEPTNQFFDKDIFNYFEDYITFIEVLKEMITLLNLYSKRFGLTYQSNNISTNNIDEKIRDIVKFKKFLSTIKITNYKTKRKIEGKPVPDIIRRKIHNFMIECKLILKELYGFYTDESNFEDTYKQNHNNTHNSLHNMFTLHIKPNIVTNNDSVFNIIKQKISEEVKNTYNESTKMKFSFNYSYEQRKFGNRDKSRVLTKKNLNVSEADIIEEKTDILGVTNKKTHKINKLISEVDTRDIDIDTSLTKYVENENIARKICFKIKIIIAALLKKDTIENAIDNKFINNTQISIINNSSKTYYPTNNVNTQNFKINVNYNDIIDRFLNKAEKINISNKYRTILGNIISKLFENQIGNSKNIFEDEINRSIEHITRFNIDVKDDNLAKLGAALIEKEAATFISNSNTDILVNYTRNRGIGDFATKKQGGVEVLVSVLDNLEDPGEETTTSNSDVATEHHNEEDYTNNYDQDDQEEQN